MAVAFIIYIAVLFKITIFRNGFGTYELMENGKINAVPIINLISVFKSNPLFFIYVFVGNIIWFIPLGFFLHKLTNLKTIHIVMIGLLLSLVIETTQYVFGVGESELDDLILNTIGTSLGVVTGKLPNGQGR
ncbi:MAG: VanZ family protein [Oscillospiraceae bacterium]|nr:VanZ family protein [Oscillospiraceae bacterium]